MCKVRLIFEYKKEKIKFILQVLVYTNNITFNRNLSSAYGVAGRVPFPFKLINFMHLFKGTLISHDCLLALT